jgi:flagellar biosynthetic protein FliR
VADLPFHLTALLLLFARVGTVSLLLPAFSEDAIPGRIRMLFGVGLAFGLYAPLHAAVTPFALSPVGLIAILVSEMMVGLALGMIVRIVFQAATMAGAIASMQIGLSSALVFDPAQGGQAPLLSRFAGVAAAVMCLSLNLHHLWIAAILKSYQAFPIGGLPSASGFADLALHAVSQSMAVALSLSAPLILYGVLFNLALGLAARMAPTIQVFFIVQPLNIMLGMTLLATIVGVAFTTFADAMAGFFHDTGLG